MPAVCPSCGAMIRSGTTFCGTCGAHITPSTASAWGPSIPAAGQGAPPYPALPAAGWGQPIGGTLWTDDGRQFPLVAPVIYIGRDPVNDVSLADGRISGRHAEIQMLGTDYFLRDLGSRNGTYLNGQRITNDCRLSDGDTILVGSTRLVFRQGSTSSAGLGAASSTQGIDPVALQALLAGGAQSPVAASAAWPAPLPPSSPVVASSLPAPASPAKRGFWASLTGPKAAGWVEYDPKENEELPPFDFSRALVVLSVTLGFLGALAIGLAAVLMIAIVLVCIGATALLFIVPFLFTPLQMLFSGLMGSLRAQKPITMVRFRIRDEMSGRDIDVTLARKMSQGGGIYQNDRVQVWGRFKAGALYASKVLVEGSGAKIRAQRPWPLWIGLLSLASVIGGLLYLATTLGLLHF